MVFLIRGLLFSFVTVLANISASASYDCASASNETERTICDYAQLSVLDEIMAEQYSNAADFVEWMTAVELKSTQRAWINERNKCYDEYGCIFSSYVKRLKEISTGLLEIKLADNFTSFIYEGEPVDGKCEGDQALSSWEQCVTWVPAGATFEGVSVSGKMAFDYFYVGSNGHMCSVSGLALRENNSWVFNDLETSCSINISLAVEGLRLSPTEQCNLYCGMRAYGGIDRILEY